MELVVELPPYRTLEKLLGAARALVSAADAIDVPDAPMGLPAPSSAVVSAIIRSQVSPPPEVIAHLRLLDVSELGALNVARALELVGVPRLVLLRGDVPSLGDPCRGVPEKVMQTIRSQGLSLRLGLLLSLAKPIDEVMRRIEARADFYLVTRPWRSPALKEVSSRARAAGSKVYVYLVVETQRNAQALAGLPRDEKVRVAEVADAVRHLSGVVDGVIISSPGDKESLLAALREARAVTG